MNKTTKLWMLFIITTSIYLVMVVFNSPSLMYYSGGMQVLDLLPFYDGVYIYQLFTQMQTEGRAYYLFRQIPIDMIYATLFGLTYYLIFKHFFLRLNTQNVEFFLILPLMGALFDLLENICIATMLFSFPNLSETLLLITPFLSLMKMIFVGTTFIVFIVFGIKMLINRSNLNSNLKL